jgi:hypothetical protein
MTTQLPGLTELTTTSDNDLLLVREASTGVDKKMRAVNLRAKATTKADVGLGNADNTSDANKPISTATQTALDAKVTGPASATNNHLPLFDGTTGKLIKGAGKGVPAGAIVGTTDTQTLTNKTLTSPAISGGTVNNASIGATTPNTGAFTTLTASSTVTLNGTTIPASATLVTTAATQTLTNKTLTTPVINTSITGTAVTQTDTDTTAGRLTKVGDFGLGGVTVAPDYATWTQNSFFRAGSSDTGIGSLGGANHNILQWGSGARRTQLIAPGSGDANTRLFLKQFRSTGAVSGTFELYHTGNTGTAVTADVTTSATDTTAGRLTKVGDLGQMVGRTFANRNADDLVESGLIESLNSSSTNIPEASFGQIRVSAASASGTNNRVVQEWFTHIKPERYTRQFDGTSWSSWQKLYTSSNLLGTVSQSAGVPTGAVIQRGSNANGEFVRFADGTLICTHTLTASSSASATWTFPSVFAAAPSFSGTAVATVSSAVTLDIATTTTAATFSARDANDARRADSVSLIAVGRWF